MCYIIRLNKLNGVRAKYSQSAQCYQTFKMLESESYYVNCVYARFVLK